MAKEPMVTVSFRLPAKVRDALRARAADEGREQSELVREAIETFLAAPIFSVEQRLQRIERRLDILDAGEKPTR